MTHQVYLEDPGAAVATATSSPATGLGPDVLAAPLIRLTSVTRTYGNGRGVFHATLELRAGHIVGLIGANGSGKTTLLRCATLFEPIDHGEISIGRHSCPAPTKQTRAITARAQMEQMRGRVIATVFQDSRPWPHLDVWGNVLLPLTRGLRLSPEEARERAEVALALLGLEDRVHAMPWQLSGGLQQRLVLARSLALKPSILFIDEGTSALDPDWTERIRRILRDYADGGSAVAVISHQMGFVRRLADTVLFMHRGQILERGTPDQIFGTPGSAELREFLANA